MPATRLLSYPLANFHQHNLIISDSYLKKKGHQKLITSSIYMSQEEFEILPTCRMKRGSAMSRIKTKTLWIYLVLDSNACKLGLSFQIYLQTMAQIPWIWWTDDAEIMELAGDKLMIILQVLTAATKKIYVSISWEQEPFNELVPALYDED